MRDRVEACDFLGVSKYLRRQCRAIEKTSRIKDRTAPGSHDLGEHGASRCHDVTADLIGIDHDGPQANQHCRDDALSGSNSAGQADSIPLQCTSTFSRERLWKNGRGAAPVTIYPRRRLSRTGNGSSGSPLFGGDDLELT